LSGKSWARDGIPKEKRIARDINRRVKLDFHATTYFRVLFKNLLHSKPNLSCSLSVYIRPNNMMISHL